MTQIQGQAVGALIDPAAAIGSLALTVADLERSLRFYEMLGFKILTRQKQQVTLGAGSTPLLTLVAQPESLQRPQRSTGLYHLAILLPTRIDLARSLQQLVAAHYPLDGASDHLVSEALYLSDPEGNGIEIYRDRPRDTWDWDGRSVKMASLPVDLAGLLAEAGQDASAWTGLPAGTRIGHIHLQVADIQVAEAFYHGVLGFDVVAQLPGALFVSAGGYHHHIGLNTWQSRNAPPPPANAVGLRNFTIVVPDSAAQEQVALRLAAAGVAHQLDERGLTFNDPWINAIVVSVAVGDSPLDL